MNLRLHWLWILVLLGITASQIFPQGQQEPNRNVLSNPIITKRGLKKYVGKEVGVFIKDINKPYHSFHPVQKSPGKLTGCRVFFDDCSITIYISTFNFIEENYLGWYKSREDRDDYKNLTWDEFKKEFDNYFADAILKEDIAGIVVKPSLSERKPIMTYTEADGSVLSERIMTKRGLKKYVEETVGVFLNDLNKPYRSIYHVQEPPGKLKGCRVFFDDCSITIYISTYNYVEKFDKSMSWKIEDILKEKIEGIVVESDLPGKKNFTMDWKYFQMW